MLLVIKQSHSPVDPSPPVLSMRLGRPHQHRHCRKEGKKVISFQTLHHIIPFYLYMTYTHIMTIT